MFKNLSGTLSRFPLAVVALCFALVAPAVFAQDEKPTVIRGELIDIVTPDIADFDLRDLPAARAWQPGDAIKEIPRRHYSLPEFQAAPQEPRRDPLLDQQRRARPADLRAAQSEQGRFPGQGFSGVQPPDPVGDVGPTYYVQLINSGAGAQIQLYDKVTQVPVLATPVNLDRFGVGNCANGLGDGIALWDDPAKRWVLTEFAAVGNVLCVYVSRTSNIFNGFYAYAFNTPSFPDYPKYGVREEAYYVTTNEAGGPAIYALERSQMLNGLAASVQRFTAPSLAGFGFQALTPGDLDGPTFPPSGTPGWIARHRDDEIHNIGSNDPLRDFIEVWQAKVDFSNPANSSFTLSANVPVTEFDSTLCGQFSFSCFPQPGTGVRLDPLREVIMHRLQQRRFGNIDVLVGNFVTDVNGANQGGIRWFVLISVGGGAWTLFDEGTYAPDSDNRFMGSAAMDKVANLVVLYNKSSSTTFPSVAAAGRFLSSPAGTLPLGEAIFAAGAASNASNRYGDYSSLNIDAADGCTYWGTAEYNPGPGSAWGTDISTFKLGNCI
ncbi:MAG: hypothetical protein GY719_22065 [bacterium]|nr:hypothetical protein [bacterium]